MSQKISNKEIKTVESSSAIYREVIWTFTWETLRKIS